MLKSYISQQTTHKGKHSQSNTHHHTSKAHHSHHTHHGHASHKHGIMSQKKTGPSTMLGGVMPVGNEKPVTQTDVIMDEKLNFVKQVRLCATIKERCSN